LADDQQILAVLDRRFNELNETIEESRTESRQRFDQLEGRMERFESQTNERFDRLEGEVRFAHVRIESLEGTVRQVAESVTALDEKVDRHKADSDRQFDDVRSLIRVSYRQLDHRVTALEDRRE